MFWSNGGFEKDTLAELIEHTASWHVNSGKKYIDCSYLVQHFDDGEEYATASELVAHNESIKDRIEELKQEAYDNRSDSQKYDDYMSDCADNNWKDRD